MKTIRTNNRHLLKIGLIGAGAVGNALALRLHQKGLNCRAVVSLHSRSARSLATKIQCRMAGSSFELLSDCNLILITVPDSQIQTVEKQLRTVSFQHNETIVAHTSGLHTSSSLERLKKSTKGRLFTASMHPMQTFPKKISWNKQTLENYFKNIYFGIEGDPVALLEIKKLIKTVGAIPIAIPKNGKTLYHVGGVFSSNFLVALLYVTKSLYHKIGLNEKKTITILFPIIRQTLINMSKKGISFSLTGPASRRDYITIDKHLRELRSVDPQYEILYKELTKICFAIKAN